MPIVHTSLFCHAPIVIPSVGGVRGVDCAETTQAMRRAARAVVKAQPAALVLISPHTPRLPRAVPVVVGALHVDFASFGAPDVAFTLPGVPQVNTLLHHAARAGLTLEPVRMAQVDHGAGVPLAFLYEAGWRGPTLLVGLPADDDLTSAAVLGHAITAWAHGQRVALVASGDGSHRIKPGAPAGFHPDAARFDAAVLQGLQARDDEALWIIDPSLRDVAAEDILSSLRVAAAAATGQARAREVLSYQAPFGVGYTVAILDDAEAVLQREAPQAPPRQLLTLARQALEAHLRGASPPPVPSLDVAASGVFVSWHVAHDDALRGCVGRVPIHAPVAECVSELAVAAATEDPRFDAVTPGEMEGLRATVTLLSEPEPARDLGALDPAIWGLSVRCGHRHGVLLPDLEGVDSVEQQLVIVLRKAHIARDEPFELYRFRASSISEDRT